MYSLFLFYLLFFYWLFLIKVQNYVTKYRREHTTTTIHDIKKHLSEHLYDEELEEDDPFYFNVNFDKENNVDIGDG